MNDLQRINKEIRRVKTAIRETDSEYLRRDYTKYLKKLLKQSQKCKMSPKYDS